MTTTANKPIKVFRLRGVKASVFENQGKSGSESVVFHKVSLQRVYRDGNEWKTTQSFGRDDIPVVRLLLQRAWEWLLEASAAQYKDDTDAHVCGTSD